MLQVFYYSVTSMRRSHYLLVSWSGERKFLILGGVSTNLLTETVPSQRTGYRFHLNEHTYYIKLKYIHNQSVKKQLIFKYWGSQISSRRQFDRNTKFYAVTLNTCGSPVQNLLVTHLAP